MLNFNFMDDAKTVTREEVLGSSAVDNAPPQKSSDICLGIFCLWGEAQDENRAREQSDTIVKGRIPPSW